MENLNITKQIETLIKENISDAQINIEDYRGDGYHFSLQVKSSQFNNLSEIDQHKLIYKALGNLVGNEIHALSLTTIPTEENAESESVKEEEISFENEILKKIHEIVNTHKVVLFMKGSKDAPMCGFSATVVNILNLYNVEYVDINVLSSSEIRENVKIYSNWPTIPQLYVNGTFVGGCDIILELHEHEGLQKILG